MKPSTTFAPRRILCPIDFSALSDLALKYAAAGARAYGATLTVLHAERFELPPYFTQSQNAELRRQLKTSKRDAQGYLKQRVLKLLSSAGSPLAIRAIVSDRHPVDAVLSAAEDGQTDLVVMGTHGRGGAQRLVLGSVAENVVRQSKVPVFVVRHKQTKLLTAKADAVSALQRILCPVNFGAAARGALVHAVSIAERFGARLTVLYALEPEDRSGVARAKEKLCSWIPGGVVAKCVWQPLVRKGQAAEQIIAFARTEQPDLIVLGAQRRLSIGTALFGTTTEAVLRQAPVPVLVVPQR
jgi:nucleotide-binding universal stress UspA family protein